MKRLKIAYLSADNPADMHVWSGTHYSIYQSLSSIGDVEILGPYSNSFILFLINLKKLFYQICYKKKYNGYHSRLLSKSYGRHFDKKIKGKNFDLIIAVSASAELAHLKTSVPVVYVSDALFSGTLNYNETLTNLCKESIKEGFETEGLALKKASLCYLSSEWAINNAIHDFKISRSKIEIGPFGANLKSIPEKEFVLIYKNQKDNSFIDLIFVGVDWENKGGPKAYNCLVELLAQGYKAQLTVVGCQIPENFRHPNIKNVQFIKKTSEEGRKKFEKLYLNADFLILPTLVEAYGIVFCEASAFGVINIAANTGGTSSPVKNDENGYLMHPDCTGKDYAEKIISIYKNKEKFSDMPISSRKRYEEVLNWNVWIQNLIRILNDKKIITSK
jgi:glycosyltransferase involved in cell wall biosynthesis